MIKSNDRRTVLSFAVVKRVLALDGIEHGVEYKCMFSQYLRLSEVLDTWRLLPACGSHVQFTASNRALPRISWSLAYACNVPKEVKTVAKVQSVCLY